MFRLEFCLPLQELIQSSIEVLQVFLILAHQVFGPLQSSSVVGLLNVTVNASIRLSMEDRPALLRSATRVFLSVMTERAATRAADCRHNRSCLRCNSRENHGSDGVPFLHEVLLSTTIRLNLRGAAGLSLFYGKSEILPPYNAQICQRIFDGLPFRSVFGRDGLNTIEDRGFCRRYSLQEPFTVKLQKRGLVVILPFGIKDFGRPRTAHKPPAQQACLHKKPSPQARRKDVRNEMYHYFCGQTVRCRTSDRSTSLSVHARGRKSAVCRESVSEA